MKGAFSTTSLLYKSITPSKLTGNEYTTEFKQIIRSPYELK